VAALRVKSSRPWISRYRPEAFILPLSMLILIFLVTLITSSEKGRLFYHLCEVHHGYRSEKNYR
jgi:hypothetical protein